MSGGTFAVSRAIWSHAAFKREAFTEREAFMWLVGEASWKPRVTRVGDLVVALERGQIAASHRFCAKAWGWTDSKVRRFFTRLQKLEMISLKTDAGVTVLTVCNYDKFQPGGASTDAGPTQDRRRTDANEKTDGIQREKGEEELATQGAAPRPANDLSLAVKRYNDAAAASGSWPQVQKITPSRSRQLRARLAECGGVEGWEVALRRAFDSDFLRGRTAKPWMQFGFDWLVRASNFTKLMEGNYDNRDQQPKHASQRPDHRADPALEQIARLAGLG